jgi:hypothetical protein
MNCYGNLKTATSDILKIIVPNSSHPPSTSSSSTSPLSVLLAGTVLNGPTSIMAPSKEEHPGPP